MPAHKKPVNTARSETVTVRLDPKVHYLARVAARERQLMFGSRWTLSSFIEWAVRQALTVDVISDDEPADLHRHTRKAPPLYNEGLWDVDEADRFFKLAKSQFSLLTIPEQRLWKLYTMHMEYTKTKISPASFREFWNDPSINTSHLKDGE